MLQFTDTQLLGWITAWFWPFCRIAALFAAAPIFQDRGIPQPAKIGLAALIAALVSPQINVSPTLVIFSWDGMLLLSQQLIIGTAIGFTMRLAFAATELAGNLVGTQMGLGFAMFFDPEHNAQTPIVGSLLGYLALLIFLSMNGHLIMIAAVTESFHTLPISVDTKLALGWYTLALQGGTILSSGFHLALPVLSTLLLTNVALGVLTRAAPQLNVFSIGFPLTLLIGIGALTLAIPYMGPLMERYLMDSIQHLGH
ncbi:MAG: flagellar biosynthetic protein FliR [Pseudomonadota bacterium]